MIFVTKDAGTSSAGSSNASAEVQKKLDVISNDVFVNALKSSGKVHFFIIQVCIRLIYSFE